MVINQKHLKSIIVLIINKITNTVLAYPLILNFKYALQNELSSFLYFS